MLRSALRCSTVLLDGALAAVPPWTAGDLGGTAVGENRRWDNTLEGAAEDRGCQHHNINNYRSHGAILCTRVCAPSHARVPLCPTAFLHVAQLETLAGTVRSPPFTKCCISGHTFVVLPFSVLMLLVLYITVCCCVDLRSLPCLWRRLQRCMRTRTNPCRTTHTCGCR